MSRLGLPCARRQSDQQADQRPCVQAPPLWPGPLPGQPHSGHEVHEEPPQLSCRRGAWGGEGPRHGVGTGRPSRLAVNCTPRRRMQQPAQPASPGCDAGPRL